MQCHLQETFALTDEDQEKLFGMGIGLRLHYLLQLRTLYISIYGPRINSYLQSIGVTNVNFVAVSIQHHYKLALKCNSL